MSHTTRTKRSAKRIQRTKDITRRVTIIAVTFSSRATISKKQPRVAKSTLILQELHNLISKVTLLVGLLDCNDIEESGCLKIKAMNVIFVIDPYDQEILQRIDEYTAVL